MPRLFLLGLLAALPLAACGGVPASLHVSATGAADLNPGPGGEAFPAQVRVYQLRATGKFDNADYFQLVDHEQAALGSDLVSRDDFILHPGETRTVELKTKPETRFVGVAVAYRNIDSATWRTIEPVRGTIRLTLDADRVTVR